MPTSFVAIIELARECIEIKPKNATFSNRNADMEAKLVEILATRNTIRSQITAAKDRIKDLKTKLANAQLALEKLASGSSKTESNL